MIRLQRIYNFDCSMLYYYLFWMIMGFIIHFYITFGTNLLTRGLAHIVVLLPVSVFRRKGISNGVQTKWNLRERYFWNKCIQETWSRRQEVNEAATRQEGAPPPSWAPHGSPDLPPSPIYTRTLKTSRSTTKNYFHRRNLLYPRDPILERSPALRRRGNRPRRASTSTP